MTILKTILLCFVISFVITIYEDFKDHLLFTDTIDTSELTISGKMPSESGGCVYVISKIKKDLLLLDVCSKFDVGDTIKIIKKGTAYAF